MLRAIFMIGLIAMLGLFAVGMVFKLFGGLVGLTFWLVALAIKGQAYEIDPIVPFFGDDVGEACDKSSDVLARALDDRRKRRL